MKSKVTAPLVILFVGFAFSLAANVMWTWDGGAVRVMGGALASCALPGAIHLWDKIHLGNSPWVKVIRAVVMTLIAVMAAYTTFEHASQLLVAHGETKLLAQLYPIMTELLVVMGVLASRAPTKKPAPTGGRRGGVQPESPSSPAAPPAPKPETVSTPPSKKTGETARQWAERNWPKTAKEIADGTGISKSGSHKVFNAVKKEKESVSS